ncbi:MAG TPA: hypothetical protein VF498_11795 [Anaerolineales bacterium]
MNPAVVVMAYDRPAVLQRLLASLEAAHYPGDAEVCLHISIDRGPQGVHPGVLEAAERFNWQAGSKRVEVQPERLGLVEHFYHCGDLACQYGSIILLEDDLAVSPVYYPFTAGALNFYAADERLAGVSLYALWFNGYTHDPFIPLADDSDVYFLQIPYTQGQAFTAAQWERFRDWNHRQGAASSGRALIHEMFQQFGGDEWFPARTRYLAETGRYFVFPRVSLSTGLGDAGTHFNRNSYFFQTPLQRFKTDYRYQALDASTAVYDSFYEILPDRLNRLAPGLSDFEYSVDLNGTKSQHNLPYEFTLTSRPGRAPLRTYGKSAWPLEANVIDSVPGKEIGLSRTADLKWGRLAEWKISKSRFAYFNRHRPLRLRRYVLLWLLEKLHLG